MVMYGLATVIRERGMIVPLTRKMHVRGPLASTHARRLPVPESFRFVTSMTLPPRPPLEAAPPPWASGNAGFCAMQGTKNPLNHSKMTAVIAAKEHFLTVPRKPVIAISIAKSV